MSKCEKCGKTYYTRECLNCRDKESKKAIYGDKKLYEQGLRQKSTYKKESNNLSEKEKLYKIIRYAIIFFMGLIIIGAIVDIVIVNYVFKTTEPMMNNVNEMTKDMMKQNRVLIKQLNQGFKPINNSQRGN